MEIKFTFLFRNEDEPSEDTEGFVAYLEQDIIPNILQVEGVSRVELDHFVPFSFTEISDGEEQKYLLQMDIYYEDEASYQQAMANFNDIFLVEELIRISRFTDLYISYIVKYQREDYQ